MAEALAAAQTLGGTIAVSSQDVGPNLKDGMWGPPRFSRKTAAVT